MFASTPKVYKNFNKDTFYKIYVYNVVVGSLFWNNLSKEVVDDTIQNCSYVNLIKRSDKTYLLDDEESSKYLKDTKVLRNFIRFLFK